MKQVTGARSICLDAYGVDSTGKRYDIEIQRADKGAGAHRARYHSSVMDVENLKEGQDFDNLPEAYIIFITEKDFYKVGKPFYEIERVNLTMGELFNDGSHILYVNGEYRGDDAIGKLMHDFNCHRAKDMLCPEMASRTRALKDTQKGRDSMCKAMEDLQREAEDRAKAEIIIRKHKSRNRGGIMFFRKDTEAAEQTRTSRVVNPMLRLPAAVVETPKTGHRPSSIVKTGFSRIIPLVRQDKFLSFIVSLRN